MKSVLAGGTCTAAILAFSLAAYAQTTGQTQPTGQSGSQPSPQSPSMDSSAQQVTIVGCVQSEGDYRRARGAGHGGAAGTGVGAGNEFVLVNASHSSGTGSDTQAGAATGSTTGATGATGTTSGTAATAPGTAGGQPSTSGSPSSTTGGTVAGTSGTAQAFELTGPGEGQLQQYVGRRVEIVGKIKGGHAAHGAAGSATSGTSSSTTTGTPSSGTTTGTQSGTSSGTGVAGATRGGSDIMGQDLNLPELEVVSVRESSGSCPAAQGQNQNPK